VDFDDVREGGAFRRIHDFNAPPAPRSDRVWIPEPDEEIFVQFEPKGTSFIQNTENPPESLFGIDNFVYRRDFTNLVVPDPTFRTSIPVYQRAYIDFRIGCNRGMGEILLDIRALELESVVLDMNRNKLTGRFLISRVNPLTLP